MPEYVVVCCYSCKLFQGQQQNKQKKFKCKVCGEKQSFRHIFAKSEYPKDIRPIIQELNRKRIEMGEKELQPSLNAEEEEFILPNQNQQMSTGNIQKESQWSQFLQTQREEEDLDEEEDPRYITDSSILKPVYQRKHPKKERRQTASHKQIADPPQPILQDTVQSAVHSFEKLEEDLREEDLYVTDLNEVEPVQEKREMEKKQEISKNSMWSSFL